MCMYCRVPQFNLVRYGKFDYRTKWKFESNKSLTINLWWLLFRVWNNSWKLFFCLIFIQFFIVPKLCWNQLVFHPVEKVFSFFLCFYTYIFIGIFVIDIECVILYEKKFFLSYRCAGFLWIWMEIFLVHFFKWV